MCTPLSNSPRNNTLLNGAQTKRLHKTSRPHLSHPQHFNCLIILPGFPSYFLLTPCILQLATSSVNAIQITLKSATTHALALSPLMSAKPDSLNLSSSYIKQCVPSSFISLVAAISLSRSMHNISKACLQIQTLHPPLALTTRSFPFLLSISFLFMYQELSMDPGPNGLSHHKPQPGDQPKPEDDFNDCIDWLHSFMHMINSPIPKLIYQPPITIHIAETTDMDSYPPPQDSNPNITDSTTWDSTSSSFNKDNADSSASYSIIPCSDSVCRDAECLLKVHEWHNTLKHPDGMTDSQSNTFLHYCTEFFVFAECLWCKDPWGEHKLVIPSIRHSSLQLHMTMLDTMASLQLMLTSPYAFGGPAWVLISPGIFTPATFANSRRLRILWSPLSSWCLHLYLPRFIAIPCTCQ